MTSGPTSRFIGRALEQKYRSNILLQPLRLCEFARTVQFSYSEKIGPEQNADNIRKLFDATLKYIEKRRNKELSNMRARLAKPDAWSNTNFLF